MITATPDTSTATRRTERPWNKPGVRLLISDMVETLSAAELVTAATAPDDTELRRAAQKHIAATASLRVARVVLGAVAKDKIAVIGEIGGKDGVPAAVLPIVLAALGRPKPDELRQVLEKIRHHRARELGVVVTHAVGDFVRAVAVDAPVRDVLSMLDWAAGDALDDGDHVRPFVAAAVAALERVPASGLDELRFATGMTELFALGGAEAAALFDRWLTAPASGEMTLRRMFDAHDKRQRSGADRKVVDWLADVWARTADRDGLSRCLAIATSQHGSITGRAWFVDWGWNRFVAHPDERAALYRGFAPWRDDLIERRNAMPRRDRPGGASAVDHLAVWGPLDLDRLREVIEEAVRLAADADWVGLVETVFAIAEGAKRDRDARMSGLVGACRLGQLLCNRVRDDNAPPALDPALDRFVALAQGAIDELRADGLELDRLIASRIDDLETSIRLGLEARAKRIAAAERDAQRAEEQRKREDDQRRREDDQRRAAEEQQRRQAELAAALAAAPPPPARPAGPGLTALPQLELSPIDREPFFTGALPTLLDYARFMVRMRVVGDAMAVMRDHGLDPMAFSTVAQAWSQLIAGRPELAQRFGALMMAPWT